MVAPIYHGIPGEGRKNPKLYWRRNYGMPYREESFISCHDLTGDQGILSTPVTDDTNPADPKLFFVTKGFISDDVRSPDRSAYKVRRRSDVMCGLATDSVVT